MEELIAIVRELAYAVHTGDKRQEVLQVLDNIQTAMTNVTSDLQRGDTGKQKTVKATVVSGNE